MRVAILYSGGKDSNLATLRIHRAGHAVVALVSVIVNRPDSWMFHIPNVGLTNVQAGCMGIPWERAMVSGEKEVEVQELCSILSRLKDKWNIEGIGTGAIASRYQRERVGQICKRLDLEELSPLWGAPEGVLLGELLDLGFEVYFTSVSAEGLGRDWLGSRLDEDRVSSLLRLKGRYGINASGEGGEYETFVCDSPLFKKKIRILEAETSWHHNAGTWTIRKFKVANK
ncbi:MAG: diphthine--ammonia ligase [Candidatus Verstraetearchaeota archaeon]|nr:diphthine--ammonia ligase [Candidatus Verstraetearchaeota archaeon]